MIGFTDKCLIIYPLLEVKYVNDLDLYKLLTTHVLQYLKEVEIVPYVFSNNELALDITFQEFKWICAFVAPDLSFVDRGNIEGMSNFPCDIYYTQYDKRFFRKSGLRHNLIF